MEATIGAKKPENWHMMAAEEAMERLGSADSGLSALEASQRLAKYGPNELKEGKKISRLAIFAAQFRSLLVIILIAATILSALVGEIIDAIAILVIVILNGIFGYVQEYRAEKTIEALKQLTKPESIVIRGGRELRIPSRELVPGDLVLLEEGARVTADLRLMETVELKIDESAITGESVPVPKNVEKLGTAALADRKNMAWAGTVVTYGRAKALVIGTGMETEIGRIAHLVQEEVDEPTPLQKKLDSFGRNLGFIILAICAIVIVVGIAREGPLAGMPLTEALIVTMIITGIALAVAAIPEGLPAVVTITLALGLQRLSKSNALMRRLPAVEALGSTTVICSDKTGTLTKNEMTVRKVWLYGKPVDVTGQGYEPRGEFRLMEKGVAKAIDARAGKPPSSSLNMLLKCAALCCNAKLQKSQAGDEWEIMGDPTEGALVVAAEKAGIAMEGLQKSYPRVSEIPFSSERKMMTTVHKSGGRLLVCVKGAPEKILKLCTKVADGDFVRTMSAKTANEILAANHEMTSGALRVLAIAYKEFQGGSASPAKDAEKDLVFLGLEGMIDPPRDGVMDEVALCKKAGIKVVMITGDHQNTAVAIAKEIGIMEQGSRSMTGEELDAIGNRELVRVVDRISVYARVNPEHKLKIVEALRERGHIIAMTGDGVNDAPALKGADIGIAMGIKGTDVAKEASDMILTDDNFSSIVKAVREGRGIYDNIKKFIQYLLSSNLGEVLIVFIAMLIGFTDPATGMIILPLAALQLLWINLLTDGLPALALGVDPPSPGIMDRRPRDPKEKILSGSMLTDIIMFGAIMTAGTLAVFWLSLPGGAGLAVTMAFTLVVMFEMTRVQAVRMRYNIGIMSNKMLIIAMAASIGLQLAVVYAPPLQQIFGTVALGVWDWALILVVCAISFAIVWIKGRVFGSKAY